MALTTYFAVEAKKGESSHDVAALILQTATNLGFKFQVLEAMDTITVGAASFVRFRSDIHHETSLLDALGRGTIALRDGMCRAILTCGVMRPYPLARLLTTPRLGQSRTYRGPGQPYAERQFGSV